MAHLERHRSPSPDLASELNAELGRAVSAAGSGLEIPLKDGHGHLTVVQNDDGGFTVNAFTGKGRSHWSIESTAEGVRTLSLKGEPVADGSSAALPLDAEKLLDVVERARMENKLMPGRSVDVGLTASLSNERSSEPEEMRRAPTLPLTSADAAWQYVNALLVTTDGTPRDSLNERVDGGAYFLSLSRSLRDGTTPVVLVSLNPTRHIAENSYDITVSADFTEYKPPYVTYPYTERTGAEKLEHSLKKLSEWMTMLESARASS